MHYVKLVFVALKCGVIMVMFSIAIHQRRVAGKFDGISLMLLLNILIMAGIMGFEYGNPFIWAFWILNFVANYINFIGFMLMIRNIQTPERDVLV